MSYPESIFEQLHAQVLYACAQQSLPFDELLCSYLAHLVTRYADISSVLTIDDTYRTHLDRLPNRELHALGDECLLHSGLCLLSDNNHSAALAPLGQTAYHLLAQRSNGFPANLFAELARYFPSLLWVLQTMADNCNTVSLLPAQLDDWRDTHDISSYRSAAQTLGDSVAIPCDTQGWHNWH